MTQLTLVHLSDVLGVSARLRPHAADPSASRPPSSVHAAAATLPDTDGTGQSEVWRRAGRPEPGNLDFATSTSRNLGLPGDPRDAL